MKPSKVLLALSAIKDRMSQETQELVNQWELQAPAISLEIYLASTERVVKPSEWPLIKAIDVLMGLEDENQQQAKLIERANLMGASPAAATRIDALEESFGNRISELEKHFRDEEF
jgi:hypothetical protein